VRGRLGELERRKFVKPGGHGGQHKRVLISRFYTFIFRSWCVEVWKNLERLEAVKASAKGVLINRVNTFVFRSQCAEVWENLVILEAEEASGINKQGLHIYL
jgi:hypothetical protein